MATVRVPDVVRSTARAHGADAWLAGRAAAHDALAAADRIASLTL